jgi:hypothetical protein
MWGTSSPGDKLTGDFGNEPEATSISDRGLFRLLAGNLSPGVFRLLQHNLPKAAILVGEAEQRRAAPEDALWMDAPDFAVAQAGLRIQSSI